MNTFIKKAKIIKVIDGDTFKVEIQGTIVNVRCILIDSPEIKHPFKNSEVYGSEANEFAKKLLLENDTVYLEFEGKKTIDKYNRLLAYVWYKEQSIKKLYNEEILRVGLAKLNTKFNYKKYLQILENAENEAKSLKLNIWNF